MNNEARNKLLNIKDHLELDKDLKIDELEKENSYLLIQVNKYKKQFANLRPQQPKQLKGQAKQDAIQLLHQKVRRVREGHVIQINRMRDVATKYRDKMNEHIEKENFITKHFILNLGKEKFIEIINRLDNPDQKSRILSKEKRDKFMRNNKHD
jgi:hemerythrin-like domain-containing protein